MQAIITKDLLATNNRPYRIKARCARDFIIVSTTNMTGNKEENHIRAAKILCAKFAKQDKDKYGSTSDNNIWSDDFVTGELPSGEMVHVFKTE